MASAAVLAAQHFPREVDDWEGLPAVDRTWRAWKVAFRLAHLKRQRQLQASGGGVTRFAALTLSYPPQPSPSTAWEQPLTTWRLRRLTKPQSSSSSQQLTWRSPRQTPCSLRPTRSSRRLWLKSRLPRPALLGYLARSTNPNLVTIVGRMATVSVKTTPVQRAVPRLRGTWTRRLPPTRWEVAISTRDGSPHVAPDGAGGQI
jgi:hypothetical protein